MLSAEAEPGRPGLVLAPHIVWPQEVASLLCASVSSAGAWGCLLAAACFSFLALCPADPPALHGVLLPSSSQSPTTALRSSSSRFSYARVAGGLFSPSRLNSQAATAPLQPPLPALFSSMSSWLLAELMHPVAERHRVALGMVGTGELWGAQRQLPPGDERLPINTCHGARKRWVDYPPRSMR